MNMQIFKSKYSFSKQRSQIRCQRSSAGNHLRIYRKPAFQSTGRAWKSKRRKTFPGRKTDLKLNVVGKIPEILLDNTDRNRTSPFAFTGNKFEIRAVGSSANCAESMTVMNTIAAKQLRDFKRSGCINWKGLKKDEAIFNVLREYIKQCKTSCLKVTDILTTGQRSWKERFK